VTNLTVLPTAGTIVGAPFYWTGSLAAATSTQIALNPITSPTTGIMKFSYNITGMNGTDFNLTNNTASVSYVMASNYQGTPVSEGFIFPAFPPTNWAVINPDAGKTWERYQCGSCGGWALTNQGTKYDCYVNTVIGDMDELYLPSINLAGAVDPQLYFDLAYTNRTGSESDKLDIYASDDCGANWTLMYSSQGSAMSTAPPTTAAFIPTANDWKTEVLQLIGFNKPAVILKFVATNDGGNSINIDNVNLFQPNPVGGIRNVQADRMNVTVYPNPANNEANVRIVSMNPQTANVTVVNALGQVVFSKETSLNNGVNNVSVDVKGLSTGIYNVTVAAGTETFSRKLTVTK